MSLLLNCRPRNVYRVRWVFFSLSFIFRKKGQLRSELGAFTIALNTHTHTPQPLFESAKYESPQCGCQTGPSCVAGRAPRGEQRLQSFRWPYSHRWRARYDALAPALQHGWSACLIFYTPPLISAAQPRDLCSCQLQLHWPRQPLVNCTFLLAKPNPPLPEK